MPTASRPFKSAPIGRVLGGLLLAFVGVFGGYEQTMLDLHPVPRFYGNALTVQAVAA